MTMLFLLLANKNSSLQPLSLVIVNSLELLLYLLSIVVQDEADATSVMSGDDERRYNMQDKVMRSVDPAKSAKEQRKSDKIDDCQKSPSRFARFALNSYHCSLHQLLFEIF